MGRHKHRPSRADRGLTCKHARPSFAPMAEGADAGPERHCSAVSRACDAFFRRRGLPEPLGSWGWGRP
jgi:hypothetical protein